MTEDFIKDSYNKYENFPDLSYNCIKYMLTNNDLIWRLLNYNDKDAWRLDATHSNLTAAQKGALIYDGSTDDTLFRVFMDVGYDSAWTIQVPIIRITPIELIPTNYVYGKVTMAFEIYSHYKINQLSNYQTRLNMLTQQIIEVFNGAEVGGIGRLFFDARASARSKMQIMGSIPYKGNCVYMVNNI
jgi:hypothetical protein